MPVAQHLLRRSVRAVLPHTASALGVDDQTLVGIGMAHFWNRKPVIYQVVHTSPGDVALATTAQFASPYPCWCTSELHKTRCALPILLDIKPQKTAGSPGSRTICLCACTWSLPAVKWLARTAPCHRLAHVLTNMHA